MNNPKNINGKVIEKYKLRNRNIGVIIEDNYGKRYSVEFESNSIRPSISNLFGLFVEPFKGSGESLEQLLQKDSYIGVDVGSRNGPVKTAYRLNYVSSTLVTNPRFRYIRPDRKVYVYAKQWPGFDYSKEMEKSMAIYGGIKK
jgi:hypothetical protein